MDAKWNSYQPITVSHSVSKIHKYNLKIATKLYRWENTSTFFICYEKFKNVYLEICKILKCYYEAMFSTYE